MVREGTGTAILTTGAVLKACVDAAALAESEGITPAVFSVPWLKPLANEPIASLAGRYDLLLTAEEAVCTGGLGGAVAEILAGLPAPRARLRRLGVTPDVILHNAHSQESGRRQVGLSPDAILAALRDPVEE